MVASFTFGLEETRFPVSTMVLLQPCGTRSLNRSQCVPTLWRIVRYHIVIRIRSISVILQKIKIRFTHVSVRWVQSRFSMQRAHTHIECTIVLSRLKWNVCWLNKEYSSCKCSNSYRHSFISKLSNQCIVQWLWSNVKPVSRCVRSVHQVRYV